MFFHKSKTPYSIRRMFSKFFLTLFAATSGVLIFYCIMFIRTNIDQMSYNTDTIVDFYVSSLQSEMTEVSSFIQKISYSDSSFKLLHSKSLTDSDKVVLQYNVTEMLKRHVGPNECIFIFNEDNSISMLAYGSSFSTNGSQYIYFLKENIKNYWLEQNRSQLNQWITFQDDQHTVLMKALKVKDTYVCTTIDLNRYALNQNSAQGSATFFYGFYDKEQLLTSSSGFHETGISLEDLANEDLSQQYFSKYYIQTTPIMGTDISLYYIITSNQMWMFAKTSIYIFILIAVITCAIIIYIFYLINHILVYPLDQINAATNHLEQNDATPFLANNDRNIIEYHNINHALAKLIDQKINLDKERQHEAIEKDHARLQYFYLQTSSHFFINCLKNLYNMLESGEYEKMRKMIIAFSNHLRYVFNDNLKLVSLEAELQEVNDYFNIILLDRETPMVLNTQVDPSLYQYKVPTLLIQTFLENTAKYCGGSSKLIMFDIKIDKTELEGVPVMQIRLSDNGIGYTSDMLKQLNTTDSNLFAKKQVGISNLKHRIALIYKSNYQFAFYNNPSGGACNLIYLPLIETFNE